MYVPCQYQILDISCSKWEKNNNAFVIWAYKNYFIEFSLEVSLISFHLEFIARSLTFNATSWISFIVLGVQARLRYHIWTLKTCSKDSQIPLFLYFSHNMSYISHFFFMSNEIILFQILHRLLKYLLFSLMKVRIINFIQCGPCFINGSKFLKIWLFETFYITIMHLVLIIFIHFIHINT